jgi:hypothetical protein
MATLPPTPALLTRTSTRRRAGDDRDAAVEPELLERVTWWVDDRHAGDDTQR